MKLQKRLAFLIISSSPSLKNVAQNFKPLVLAESTYFHGLWYFYLILYPQVGVKQPVHSFLGGKGLGIQQGKSVGLVRLNHTLPERCRIHRLSV